MKEKILKYIAGIVLMVLCLPKIMMYKMYIMVVGSFTLYILWNLFIPDNFNLPYLSYYQSVAIRVMIGALQLYRFPEEKSDIEQKDNYIMTRNIIFMINPWIVMAAGYIVYAVGLYFK